MLLEPSYRKKQSFWLARHNRKTKEGREGGRKEGREEGRKEGKKGGKTTDLGKLENSGISYKIQFISALG